MIFARVLSWSIKTVLVQVVAHMVLQITVTREHATAFERATGMLEMCVTYRQIVKAVLLDSFDKKPITVSGSCMWQQPITFWTVAYTVVSIAIPIGLCCLVSVTACASINFAARPAGMPLRRGHELSV